eukprot:UN23308
MVADCWLRTKTNTLETRSSRTELIFDLRRGHKICYVIERSIKSLPWGKTEGGI